MKIKLRTLIIIVTISAIAIAGCQPIAYVDQRLPSETVDDSPYTRIHMDKFIDQKNDVLTRFTDPDNGNICYFRGEGLVCFKGE